MNYLLKRFAAVAGLTLLEALRQPILLLLTTTCVVFIALLPALLMHTMGDAQKVVQDSALAVQFVGGLLLGGYAASASLGREIRRGTLATVLSKPVERELFFLAKFTGIMVMLALYSGVTGMATLLGAHMAHEAYTVNWGTGAWLLGAVAVAYGTAGAANYFRHRPFVSTAFVLLVVATAVALLASAQAGDFPWRVVPASVLVAMATLLLAAVALGLVTRLDLVATLAAVTIVFLAGLMTDYLLGRAAETDSLAAFVYNLLPNWQHFWTADALAGEGRIPWTYVRQVSGYAIFYLLGTLSLGMLAFRNVETKA